MDRPPPRRVSAKSIIAAAGFLVVVLGATAASANCANPSGPNERRVCEDPRLLALSEEVNRDFAVRAEARRSSPADYDAFVETQRVWAAKTRDCSDDSSCIFDALVARNQELAVIPESFRPPASAVVATSGDSSAQSSPERAASVSSEDLSGQSAAKTDVKSRPEAAEATNPELATSGATEHDTPAGRPLTEAERKQIEANVRTSLGAVAFSVCAFVLLLAWPGRQAKARFNFDVVLNYWNLGYLIVGGFVYGALAQSNVFTPAIFIPAAIFVQLIIGWQNVRHTTLRLGVLITFLQVLCLPAIVAAGAFAVAIALAAIAAALFALLLLKGIFFPVPKSPRY